MQFISIEAQNEKLKQDDTTIPKFQCSCLVLTEKKFVNSF